MSETGIKENTTVSGLGEENLEAVIKYGRETLACVQAMLESNEKFASNLNGKDDNNTSRGILTYTNYIAEQWKARLQDTTDQAVAALNKSKEILDNDNSSWAEDVEEAISIWRSLPEQVSYKAPELVPKGKKIEAQELQNLSKLAQMYPQTACDELNRIRKEAVEIITGGDSFCEAFVDIQNTLADFAKEILDTCVNMCQDFSAVGQNAGQYIKNIRTRVSNMTADNKEAIDIDIDNVGKNLRSSRSSM